MKLLKLLKHVNHKSKSLSYVIYGKTVDGEEYIEAFNSTRGVRTFFKYNDKGLRKAIKYAFKR